MIIGARSTKLATRDVEVVPGAGVEPARPLGRGILSPLCLPIPPPGRHKPLYLPGNGRRESACGTFPSRSGAGKESRTLDLYLGKVSLYQLSYSRAVNMAACHPAESPEPHDVRRAGAARIIRRQTGTVNPRHTPGHPRPPAALPSATAAARVRAARPATATMRGRRDGEGHGMCPERPAATPRAPRRRRKMSRPVVAHA